MYVSQFNSSAFSLTVTQLQTTLAAVQELLIQQQQKIQELTQELAASKVPTSNSSPLEHHQFWNMHGFFCGHVESTYWVHNPGINSAMSPTSFSASDFFMGGVVRALDMSWVLTEIHLILERALLCSFGWSLCVWGLRPILSSVSSVLHLRWNCCGVSPLTKRGKDQLCREFFLCM